MSQTKELISANKQDAIEGRRREIQNQRAANYIASDINGVTDLDSPHNNLDSRLEYAATLKEDNGIRPEHLIEIEKAIEVRRRELQDENFVKEVRYLKEAPNIRMLKVILESALRDIENGLLNPEHEFDLQNIAASVRAEIEDNTR